MLNMTTSNVVTMEYVPGIKINDIQRIEEAGIDRTLLAQRSAEAYLTQLCRHGFFRKYTSHIAFFLNILLMSFEAVCNVMMAVI
jgi:ABC1 atypical kinase-like domain